MITAGTTMRGHHVGGCALGGCSKPAQGQAWLGCLLTKRPASATGARPLGPCSGLWEQGHWE